MAVDTLERTKLWTRAFNSQDNCNNNKHRLRLKDSLLKFRERVGTLLTFIPGDMKFYTVHDLSHLDALWEMAELIAGESFSLNPAEAFVFGGAVLLHDAGMSIAAYPEGIDAIKALPEWKDSYAWACSVLKVTQSASNQNEATNLAITDVLRKMHAVKAEQLATQKWLSPIDRAEEFLLEDSELRMHFGRTIGLIAHSHHWNIKRLVAELQSTLGAYGEMPSDWVVDCVKVALLLRCADAAHLDHRRAPSLLFALTKPTGIALTHWKFQAKLAKPQAVDGKLLYTSSSTFSLADVGAWHLCWDTIKMVDNELSDSCDVLRDRKSTPFSVSGVVGAKSADALAKHVQVDGWRPIPTELQVSDVPHLARTLGGTDLYSSPIAPLRELIQNSADAIDARLALDKDFSISESRITIKVNRENGLIKLSVEDDGLGMSERTLTGALLDFGTSFWKSDAARNEFPGLQCQFVPRGRYGIGFFSVFMWADSVKVSSRKFSEGISEAKVLEFTAGLGSRPILRPAESAEASMRFSTKITLEISEQRWLEIFGKVQNGERVRSRYEYFSGDYLGTQFLDRPDKEVTVARLTAMLKIPVYFDDTISVRLSNLPNWETAGSDQFISFLEKLSGVEYSEKLKRFAKSESLIHRDGKIVGRAFLCPSIRGFRPMLSSYELGIFVENNVFRNAINGFVEGKAINAARDRVNQFNIFEDNDWVEKQIDYMSRLSGNMGEHLSCQESLIVNGRIARTLPIVLLNRKACSLDDLAAEGIKRQVIRVVLVGGDEGRFQAKAVERADPFIGRDIDEDKVYFLVNMGYQVGSDELEQLILVKSNPLAVVLREIKNSLGSESVIHSRVVDVQSYSSPQELHLEFRRGIDLSN